MASHPVGRTKLRDTGSVATVARGKHDHAVHSSTLHCMRDAAPTYPVHLVLVLQVGQTPQRLEHHVGQDSLGDGAHLVHHVRKRATVHVLQRYGDGAFPVECAVEANDAAKSWHADAKVRRPQKECENNGLPHQPACRLASVYHGSDTKKMVNRSRARKKPRTSHNPRQTAAGFP